jgi:hypothetical protein
MVYKCTYWVCGYARDEYVRERERERERARQSERARASERKRRSERASARKNVLCVCRYVYRPASSHIALLLHLSNPELGSLQFLLLFRRLRHDLCIVCVCVVCVLRVFLSARVSSVSARTP